MNLPSATPTISTTKGFKRFCIGHELGHYRLPGHVDAVLAHGDVHESHAGFISDDPYEREADNFAAGLLMPDPLFSRELRRLGDGLQAVEALADRCIVSLTAAALRYVEKASVPVAMVVSIGPHIDYCFMSKPLLDFDNFTWPHKGQILPKRHRATDHFNANPANVPTAQPGSSRNRTARLVRRQPKYLGNRGSCRPWFLW